MGVWSVDGVRQPEDLGLAYNDGTDGQFSEPEKWLDMDDIQIIVRKPGQHGSGREEILTSFRQYSGAFVLVIVEFKYACGQVRQCKLQFPFLLF